MTTTQFFSDIIDQMDLALDQLAVCDRNFDRFALMLIDNVVELTLHKIAQDKAAENKWMFYGKEPKNNEKMVAGALGQHFEAKVKLAKHSGVLSDDLAESILNLHSYRNTSYHRGVKHEGILHSLTVYYFGCACKLLQKHSPIGWSSGSADVMPHRALKYLGNARHHHSKEAFSGAWLRLHEVVEAIPSSLLDDLWSDMKGSIDQTDEMIDYLATGGPEVMARDQVLIDSQSWAFAFTNEGKLFAQKSGCPQLSVKGYVDWIAQEFPWPIKKDPIPSWNKRLKSLESETSPHRAFKKYCDFMMQTKDIRALLDEAAAQLDRYIDEQIDIARGK